MQVNQVALCKNLPFRKSKGYKSLAHNTLHFIHFPFIESFTGYLVHSICEALNQRCYFVRAVCNKIYFLSTLFNGMLATPFHMAFDANFYQRSFAIRIG